MKSKTHALLLAFATTLAVGGNSNAQTTQGARAYKPPSGSIKIDSARMKVPNGYTQGKLVSVSSILGTPSYERDIGGTKVRTKLFLKPEVRGSRASGLEGKENGVQEGPKGDMYCRTSTASVSLSDDTFKSAATSANATKLYPGAIYEFESFFSGRMNPVAQPRNPIVLMVSNVADITDPDVEVLDPAQNTIERARLKLVNQFSGSGAADRFSAHVYRVHNAAASQLNIAGSAAGWGASLDFSSRNAEASEYQEFLIDATQEMYTLTALPSVNGFFVDPGVAGTGQKLVMSTVTYGQRVLLSVKTKFASTKAAHEANAAYAGLGYGASVSLGTINSKFGSESEIKVFTIGGEKQGFLPLKVDDVEAWLKNYLGGTSMKNAKPISYQFSNMNNDLVRSESATGNFPVTNCVPENVTLTATLDQITSARPELVKFGTRQVVSVSAGGQTVWDYRGAAHAILCWWGTEGEVAAGCKAVREAEMGPGTDAGFKIGERRQFKLRYSQVKKSDKITFDTKYIAMYKTRLGGKTNSLQNVDVESVYINDITSAPGGVLKKVVEVPFQGRMFKYHYTLDLR